METTSFIFLRAVHVLAGSFWLGAALMLVAFVAPCAQASGAAGDRFMQRLLAGSRFPQAMGAASLLASAAGLWLLWSVSGGLRGDWFATPSGVVYALAALAGLAALGVGLAVNKPTAQRLAALGERLAGSVDAADAARLQALQARLRAGGQWGAALLVLSTLGMAVASHA